MVKIVVRGHWDPDNEWREPIATRVLESFASYIPDHRLLCFVDECDWHALKTQERMGVWNRGFYMRVRRSDEIWDIAPVYILATLFDEHVPLFDHFIYLHGTTCERKIGLAMTLAHELQHFVQRTTQTRLWAANTLVPHLTKSAIEELGLRWCDIPHERDARIISKRTAESLFGAEDVRTFISERIAESAEPEEVADWRCIQDLTASTPFDLARETVHFFPRLNGVRPQLRAVLDHFRSGDSDFASVDLDGLLRGMSTN